MSSVITTTASTLESSSSSTIELSFRTLYDEALKDIRLLKQELIGIERKKDIIIEQQAKEIETLKARLRLYQKPLITPLSSTRNDLVWDDHKGRWIKRETV